MTTHDQQTLTGSHEQPETAVPGTPPASEPTEPAASADPTTARELFDQVGHQDIGLLDAVLGIIDEARLHGSPPCTQFREVVIGEEHLLR